jgi:hypothetical protein
MRSAVTIQVCCLAVVDGETVEQACVEKGVLEMPP